MTVYKLNTPAVETLQYYNETIDDNGIVYHNRIKMPKHGHPVEKKLFSNVQNRNPVRDNQIFLQHLTK